MKEQRRTTIVNNHNYTTNWNSLIFALLLATLTISTGLGLIRDKAMEQRDIYMSCTKACNQKADNVLFLAIGKQEQPKCDGTTTALCINECNKIYGIK